MQTLLLPGCGNMNMDNCLSFLFFSLWSSRLHSSSTRVGLCPRQHSGRAVVTGVFSSPLPYMPSFYRAYIRVPAHRLSSALVPLALAHPGTAVSYEVACYFVYVGLSPRFSASRGASLNQPSIAYHTSDTKICSPREHAIYYMMALN